jgi:predicted TIM-barrel fold metal-dependent hydrolase
MTRRDALSMLAAAPFAATAGCCKTSYPVSVIPGAVPRPPVGLAAPMARARGARRAVDAHAHFFNGSDVPVRGFIAECIGHNAPAYLQPLIKALALLAEKIVERAPTAGEELGSLQSLGLDLARLKDADRPGAERQWFGERREKTIADVVEVVRGSEFERRYLELTEGSALTRSGRTRIDQAEVRGVVQAARQRDVAKSAAAFDRQAADARAQLEFLYYMLAPRAENLRAYIEGCAGEGPAGVDLALGALVDFDYWLDCPPASSHADQVTLHRYLATLHGGFLRPLLAYNPWSDIEQKGASLARLLTGWDAGGIAGVKIYPPTGFMPEGNASVTVNTRKRRPDLRALDETLDAFFAACANRRIPVLAHAARSNGRDHAHDEFSAPEAWDRRLARMTAAGLWPTIVFGHFGGDTATVAWTEAFVALMKKHPGARLYADLGYWETLLCADVAECAATKARLKTALETAISADETGADRVLFATDWLMLSQVSGWREYPARVRQAVREVAPAAVERVMARNAEKCFAIPPST